MHASVDLRQIWRTVEVSYDTFTVQSFYRRIRTSTVNCFREQVENWFVDRLTIKEVSFGG